MYNRASTPPTPAFVFPNLFPLLRHFGHLPELPELMA